MKMFLRRSFLLVLLCLASLAVTATTYYVKTDGNNSLNGLSVANAWQTLEYAFRSNGPLVAGDVVQLSAGNFTNIMGPISIPAGVSLIGSGIGVTNLSAHSSYFFTYTGSEDYGQHFLFYMNSGSYTEQAQTLKDFTILGNPNNTTSKLHGGISVWNRGALTFENIEVKNTNFCAIWWSSVKNSVMRNVSTKDCSWGVTNGAWVSGAIQIANLQNVELVDLDIDEGRGYGIKGLPETTSFDGLEIHDSRISVNPQGLWSTGVPNITLELKSSGFHSSSIHHNYFDNTVSLIYLDNAPHGTVAELQIYDNKFNILGDALEPSRANGYGYGLECSINDVEIFRNTFNGGARGIGTFMGYKHYNWKVHHNVFYGLSDSNPTAAVFLTGGKPNSAQDGGVIGLSIFNNTLHITGTSTVCLYSSGYNALTTGAVIKNNLVINEGNGGLPQDQTRVIRLSDTSTMPSPDISNNDFFNISLGISGHPNNDNVNPQITASGNKPTPYYTLAQGSPLIDSGAVIAGYSYLDSAPDIGAYETAISSIAVTGVSLTPASLTLSVGTNNYQLVKTITPSNASNPNVTWTSSNQSVATVNSLGQVTALAVGSTTITATSVSNSTVSGTASVTVTQNTAGPNVVSNPEFDSPWSPTWSFGDWTQGGGSGGNALSVVQGAGMSGANSAYIDVVNTHTDIWRLQLYQQLSSFSLQVGKTYEISFMAKAAASRTMVVALHGNTSNTDYFSTNVNLTTSPQTYTYSYNCTATGTESSISLAFFLATSTATDVWIDNVSVRDITVVPVASVTLAPTTATVAVGATAQLTPTVSPANATNKNVTWSTSNINIATVNSTGLVTAVAAGSATITVTTVDGSKTATAAITVVVPVTSVTVAPTTATVAVGATTQLTPTVSPANATNKNVTWSSSNVNIANVNSTGLVTAVAAGSATITVTTVDGNKTATAAITVVVPVTSVTVAPTTATIAVGATSQLTPTVNPANATNKNVTWSTSNASIATVNSTGLVTAVAAGSATITVTTVDGSKTATAAITVVVPVTSVTVAPTTATVAVGATAQLTPTVNPANATNKNVTWSTSNASIATVNSTGLVTAVAAGSATITVTTVDGSKTATAAITVVVPVTSVTVAPTTATIAVGATAQLTPTVNPANATNKNVTWSTSNASIATVNSTGLVTAVAAGSATITVTTVDGSKTATASVTVTASGGTNVVLNNEFDNGTTNWTLGDWSGPNFTNGGNSFSVVQGAGMSGTNAVYINVVNTNSTAWTLQLQQQLGLMLQVGKTYEISFMAKAQSARTIVAALHGNTNNVDYWSTTASLTTTGQNFGPYTFTCSNSGVSGESSFSIAFFLSSTAVNDVWIDKVSVKDITGGVPVTGISVSPATATLTLGGTSTQQLTKTITPANATNQNASWTSSNTSVATVNASGLVTGVGAGTATITATTQDGSFTATSAITVNDVTTVDDAVMGTGTNQHNYAGANWTHANTVPAFLNSTLSYSNVTNQSVTISFVGNKIEWFTEKKNTHGIAAVSIDNGTEVMVDLYAATAQQQLLVYTSPALTQGTHTFKIRVTGTKNASSSNYWAIHDYVKIYSSAGGGGGGGNRMFYTMDEQQVTAYPNPVKSGEILRLAITDEVSEIKMMDAVGRTRPVPVSGREIEIPTSDLTNGLHIIQYRIKKGVKHIKVLIN